MSTDNYYDYRLPDRTSSADASSTPTWVLGLIAGAALGSGLALLFAPRQGAATRHQLAERGHEAGRQMRHAYASVAGTARRNARRLSDQAQEWRRQRSEAAGARESIYGDYGAAGSTPASEAPNLLRDGIHEVTPGPTAVTPGSDAPGATSAPASEPRSPFA